MGAIRVTQQMMADIVLSNISRTSREIMALQEQLASGQRVNRPSDDPLAARRAVSTRSEIQKLEQYIENISTIGPTLTETESSILLAEDLRQRAYELTLQGLNSTNGLEERRQIATEINQLLESLLVEGNHETNGRYIFGGTRTLNRPFVETRGANGEITAVAYEGNAENIEIEVSEGVRVAVNESGEDLFMSAGGADHFQTLIDLRDHLRANDRAGMESDLSNLQAGQDQLLAATARIGSVQNRIERIDTNLQDIVVQLEKVVSDNIDADLAELIIDLESESNALQAALNAGGRLIQPSLLDYLR